MKVKYNGDIIRKETEFFPQLAGVNTIALTSLILMSLVVLCGVPSVSAALGRQKTLGMIVIVWCVAFAVVLPIGVNRWGSLLESLDGVVITLTDAYQTITPCLDEYS